jgi:signal transduction histidine kinase
MAPSDIEAPQYAAKVPERIDELRRTHFSLSETAYVHKDGTVIPIELSSRIIEFKGRSVILSIARDISDRKKLTEIREQFLSHVTHELRTPLGPLKLHLDYAVAGKLGPVPEKLKSSLHVMKRSVDRLHELTNELLDLRRIQAGRFQLNLESMNFREILDDSIEEIQAQTDQKKQRVHVGVTEGPLPIRGDQTRLRQVLTNLLNNASKYTPEEGAITIKVGYDGDTIKCRISDTGIGIGKEDLPKVFEPFSNIKKPSSIQTAGLGLSVTKGIVEAHGGKIWVESEGEGKGATFIFTLPKLTRVLQT